MHNSSRKALPGAVNSRHFFYLSTRPNVPTAAVETVVAAAQSLVRERGLLPAQIEAFSSKQLEGAQNGAGNALMSLRRALKLPADTPSAVVACEWASPHVDELFAGQAFVSLVLHTGPEPYVVQTLHTEHRVDGNTLVTSTRMLRQGDVMVLDPTVAHFAAPRSPGSNQLLVLLQFELPDQTELDRANLLKQFPPDARDKDAWPVFDAIT